jgi:hypothetical protein
MQIQIHAKFTVDMNNAIEWKIICSEHGYGGIACNLCHFARLSKTLNEHLKALKI